VRLAAPPQTWTKTDNFNQGLLPYLLAWNHGYSTFFQSDNKAVKPYVTGPKSSFFSQLQPDNTSFANSPQFDLFVVTMPQTGSTRIVFTSNRDNSNGQIYSMDANGGNVIRLTSNGSNDDHPRWSPNGTKILFQSDRDSLPPDPENPAPGKQDIYLMNGDGTGQTRLTTDAADDCNAMWSADGAKIVFQSLRNASYYQVYMMNADGTSQTNLSNGRRLTISLHGRRTAQRLLSRVNVIIQGLRVSMS
jgi:dipeptidyl aminopeptidase/acylaminoacyl peptidase